MRTASASAAWATAWPRRMRSVFCSLVSWLLGAEEGFPAFGALSRHRRMFPRQRPLSSPLVAQVWPRPCSIWKLALALLAPQIHHGLVERIAETFRRPCHRMDRHEFGPKVAAEALSCICVNLLLGATAGPASPLAGPCPPLACAGAGGGCCGLSAGLLPPGPGGTGAAG